MFGLSKEEIKFYKKLNNPKKIQDFLNTLKINFEPKGETSMSPRTVLKAKKCHCIEGAVLAALILRVNGYKPLLMDLEATKNDFDHVVALFQIDGKWGAISKTNHAVLRYREPVYDSPRELAMSYFHEYFDKKGNKNLRKYSDVVDLSMFDKKGWMTTEDEVWYIPEYLVKVKHHDILTRKQKTKLRKADNVELRAAEILEWKSKHMKENL